MNEKQKCVPEHHPTRDDPKEPEQLMQSAIDGLSTHIAILGNDGRIITVNKAWRLFAEVSHADLAKVGEGADYLAVCEEAKGDDASEALAVAEGIRAILEGKSDCFEMEYPCHSPEENRWFLCRALPFQGKRRRRVVVDHENITRQKLAEIENRKHLAFLNETQQISKNGGWEYDTSTRRIDWTDEVYRIHGVSRETYDPNNIQNDIEFYAPEDQDRIRMAFQTAVKEGRPYNLKLRFHSADGRHLWVRTSGKAEWRENKIVRVFGNIMDITEYQILEEQLQQAQKMESIGILAGGIAHDFNNILSAIIGYTELAMDVENNDDAFKEYLSQVLKAGHRARNLVSQILSFSRRSESVLVPLQVHLVVKEVLKMMRATLPTTISIIQKINASSSIMGDPTQIYQAIMNICTNAYHAMHDAGGELTVELSEIYTGHEGLPELAELPPGSYLKITISDTGIGMDESVRKRVFEPYFTTKGKGQGTGLGLSIVYSIIKAHGGEIRVESEAGKGSAFHLFFPKIEEPVEPAVLGKGEDIPTGTERVLFIDDEPALTLMAQKALESLGYQVTLCRDGRDALRLFKNNPDYFDLVITDMTMPKMTGDVMAMEMIKTRPGIPVIICTGFSDLIDDERARDSGISALLNKPFTQGELARQIRKVLDSVPL